MKARNLLVALGILVLIAGGAGAYKWYQTDQALTGAKEALASTSAALETAKGENRDLSEAYEAEKARNDGFESQIHDLSGTVGKLDKLSRIDPQLLAKYSKIYFLNENYTPANLTQIPAEYASDSRDKYFLKEAWPFLKDLLDAAKDDGVDLSVLSSYRSFDSQELLKSSYKVTYGTGANAFSADQGYSEHQLGTALDFTTDEIGGGLTGFEKTKAYTWLSENAYKYGFILSYPKGNTYYVYEPWHWRFVGRDLAHDLHDDGKNFYDLDQRDINGYLISLYD